MLTLPSMPLLGFDNTAKVQLAQLLVLAGVGSARFRRWRGSERVVVSSGVTD